MIYFIGLATYFKLQAFFCKKKIQVFKVVIEIRLLLKKNLLYKCLYKNKRPFFIYSNKIIRMKFYSHLIFFLENCECSFILSNLSKDIITCEEYVFNVLKNFKRSFS
jgi:hypothetical protein